MKISNLTNGHLPLPTEFFANGDQVIIVPTLNNRLNIYPISIWQSIEKSLHAKSSFTKPRPLHHLSKPIDVYIIESQKIKLSVDLLNYIQPASRFWMIEHPAYIEIRPVISHAEIALALSLFNNLKTPALTNSDFLQKLENVLSNKYYVYLSDGERRELISRIALSICFSYKWKEYKATNITWRILSYLNLKLEQYEKLFGKFLGVFPIIEQKIDNCSYIASFHVEDHDFDNLSLITRWFNNLGIFNVKISQFEHHENQVKTEERIWKIYFSLPKKALKLAKKL